MRLLIVTAFLMASTPAFAHDEKQAPQAAAAKPAKASAAAKPVARALVTGHSGGTDANGCHTNSQTGDYHCHNPK